MDNTLAYEDAELMSALVAKLKDRCQPGERVIWRGPFRWRDGDGNFLSNHYEMFELSQLEREFDFEVVWDFTHAAIIRNKIAAVAAA
jgi:hypothetical protein